MAWAIGKKIYGLIIVNNIPNSPPEVTTVEEIDNVLIFFAPVGFESL
jgi:hypothetical protein